MSIKLQNANLDSPNPNMTYHDKPIKMRGLNHLNPIPSLDTANIQNGRSCDFICR